MELLNYIKTNENWKQTLTEPPYSLNVKEEDGFVILKYDMIYSDFSEPIVNECRGLILDGKNKTGSENPLGQCKGRLIINVLRLYGRIIIRPYNTVFRNPNSDSQENTSSNSWYCCGVSGAVFEMFRCSGSP